MIRKTLSILANSIATYIVTHRSSIGNVCKYATDLEAVAASCNDRFGDNDGRGAMIACSRMF
jgi:hypothetical protein